MIKDLYTYFKIDDESYFRLEFLIWMLVATTIFLSSCKLTDDNESQPELVWQSIELPEEDPMSATISGNGILYAIAAYPRSTSTDINRNLLYFSNDMGVSWDTLTVKTESGMYGKIYQLFPFDENNLMAIGEEGFANEKILYSKDGGKNWKSSDPFNLELDFNVVTDFKGTIAIGGGILFEEKNFFISTDYGESWSLRSLPKNNYTIKPVIGMDETYFACADKLYRSDDGGKNWSDTGIEYPISAAANTKGNVVVVTGSGVLLSDDNGDSWISSNSNYALNNLQVISLSDDSFIMMNSQGRLFYSPDGSDSWSEINTPMEGGGKLRGYLGSITRHNRIVKVLYQSPDDRLYITNKFGREPEKSILFVTKNTIHDLK